jgi:predicted nucleotidyltransferase/DNA-binding XRE family transcriptional regulator
LAVDTQSLVRHARLRAQLTQAQLAERAGTSQPAIARYESGEAVPSLPTLERLLRVCGLELRVEGVAGVDARPTSVRASTGDRARLLRRRRRTLLDVLRREGARNPRVFGSVARGDEGPASDIDLLVDLDPEATLLDLARLRRSVQEAVGAPVDVAVPSLLKESVRARAETEAIPL